MARGGGARLPPRGAARCETPSECTSTRLPPPPQALKAMRAACRLVRWRPRPVLLLLLGVCAALSAAAAPPVVYSRPAADLTSKYERQVAEQRAPGAREASARHPALR